MSNSEEKNLTNPKNSKQINPNVPNLRFKKWISVWRLSSIRNAAPLQRGFDLPAGEIRDGSVPVVYSNGILRFHDRGKAMGPGIVTGRSGTIGKFTFIERGPYWPHNTSLWVTDFKGNDPLFIFYAFQNVGFEKYATGSGVPTLNRNCVMQHIIGLPNIEEQRRISSFLKIVDERIFAQNKIIEGYVRLKEEALRRLFPVRGKCNVGNEEPLSKFLHPGSKQPVDPLKHKRITIHLNLEGLSFSDPTRELKDARPFFVRRAGELIIGKQNYFCGSICIVDKQYDMAVCSNAIMSFGISGINPRFLLYATSNKGFLEARKFYANGTGQKELSEKDFLNFSITVPDHALQSAIANAIDSIESKISFERRALSYYIKMKRYLLSAMFI